MRILWVVNIAPSELADAEKTEKTSLGGWIESMSDILRKTEGITLAIACRVFTDEEFVRDINGVRYYSISYKRSKKLCDFEKRCSDITADFAPDIVHIEGTEFIHALAFLNVSTVKTVISLQGILNGQYQYQCGQLQIDDMMFSSSLTNICAGWLLHLRKRCWYKPRMKYEAEIIGKATDIIGRTTWDRAHAYALNPNARYYSCNRVLRHPFYENKWDISSAEKHSLYVGNAYRALKGFHFVIEALPELIREYPDIIVYAAGTRPYEDNDKRAFFKRGYGSYIKRLMKKKGVEKHIVFLGEISAVEVAERLSQVNAYILCSAAENSPNTLGEAMAVGTPCIAAYVGGVPDMAVDGKEALFYRNDDPAMLAWAVKRVFDDDGLALALSENGKKRAAVTHDEKINSGKLISIYKEICGL